MKKILLFAAVALALTACTKEPTEQQPSEPSGIESYDTVQMQFKFSPYEVSPMKGNTKATSSVSSVCSRLDIYIIDIAEGDTMRWHQERTATTSFGTLTATLKTNKNYHLYAVAHNTTDTATFSGGVFSFDEDRVKQCMVADTIFSPGDGLSLNVTMLRIVGMFKLRIADPDSEFQNVTGFTFDISPSGRKWDMTTMQSTDRVEQLRTINGTARLDDGYVTYNVYVMGDDMTTVKYIDVTVSAIMTGGAQGETREFSQVPIKNGYITTYTGTFFITFDMGFTFLVGDWSEYGSYTF